MASSLVVQRAVLVRNDRIANNRAYETARLPKDADKKFLLARLKTLGIEKKNEWITPSPREDKKSQTAQNLARRQNFSAW